MMLEPTAALAHELRNPRMPIKTLVQATVDRGDGGVLRGRSLLIIAEEIARLECSIQQFLDFARPSALQNDRHVAGRVDSVDY